MSSTKQYVVAYIHNRRAQTPPPRSYARTVVAQRPMTQGMDAWIHGFPSRGDPCD